jgi:ribulose-phosphate 3-epimerase
MTPTASKRTIQFSPSLLSVDFVNLERDVRLIEAAPKPPEWLHVDVMDGHFVPNLTIGPPIVRALKRIAQAPLDVHLMIDNPAEQLDWFISAGADLITVHVECAGGSQAEHPTAPGESRSIQSVENPELIHALISRIHAAGRKAGLSLNPGTPVTTVLPFLPELDLVLVMSVHPGFGGQSFIASAVDKVAAIAASAEAAGRDAAAASPLIIEVDGGINTQTAPQVSAAGATLLVAGNAIFGASDPQAALQALRESV